MWNKLIKDVALLIENCKDQIPAGYKLWRQWYAFGTDSLDQLFHVLLNVFEKEEKAIEAERKKTYVTDIYEDKVRGFARLLVMKLMEHPVELIPGTSHMYLMGQKHMAYAFYHLLDEKRWEQDNDLLRNNEYAKCLYKGLLNFYSTYRGNFQDNEEAIRLICKYYPKGDDLWLHSVDVIEALHDHIRNAGSAVDLGYAFRGIEQIQNYIHGLPDKLIIELINEYRLYDVLNQPIYRHQIFAMIDGTGLSKEEKHSLKFFYLDSLLLANLFNGAWIKRKKEQNEEIKIHYITYEVKLGQRQIQVLENPEAYWDHENMRERVFFAAGRLMARVFVEKDKIIFSFLGNQEVFPFQYDDWALEGFRTGQTESEIDRLVSNSESRKQQKNPMIFSLLYLDNYRGIKRQVLDFDHRFTFDPDNKKLKRREKEQNSKIHFYGRQVYSLTCIVGKNGTGKTSIVDFMRDVFYKVLKVMEDFEILCERGYVELNHFAPYKFIDEPITFLVVFRCGQDDYFLTNIVDISSMGVLPYQIGICHNIDFCKVAYFSKQFSAIQAIRTENQKIGRGSSGLSRTLEGLGHCDYSETRSFWQRKNAMAGLKNPENSGLVNMELCYQFSLLRNIDIEKFCTYLDVSLEREFTIYSLESGDILERFTLRECRDISKIRELEKQYVRRPDVGLGFVSSGQYAKFMFLAKLHWFLKGYHIDSAYYNKIVGDLSFRMENALQEGETALVFIDEGEVYYHPEWQRRYLSTLLDMLCLIKGRARIQVVFTTNSPFVISDVLREDVQYLSGREDEIGDTLGQNIHKLLIKNFFMDYTIGEYSRKLIEAIIFELSDEKRIKPEDILDICHYFDRTSEKCKMMGFLIQQIGEPIYRDKLEKMLVRQMKIEKDTKESQIRELERLKEDLEKRLIELKGETNDSD